MYNGAPFDAMQALDIFYFGMGCLFVKCYQVLQLYCSESVRIP